jgi:hypothetical protein
MPLSLSSSRVQGPGLRLLGLRDLDCDALELILIQGSGFRVQGSGFRLRGLGNLDRYALELILIRRYENVDRVSRTRLCEARLARNAHNL